MNKLFIVDDSEMIRERLIHLLSDEQNLCVVGHAATAEHAARSIDELLPDTLLLDVRLPGKSGIELLSEIKQRHPEMHVIIMTNYDYPHYRRQSLKAGADAFFNKTTQFEELIAVLKQPPNDTTPKGGTINDKP